MKVEKLPLPLSELLRPSSLEDLVLADHQVKRLSDMIARGSISNMIFYGSPGTGKTSTARIIGTGIDADVFSVDGANERGPRLILHDVPDFVRTASLFGKRKLVVIDEGEFMTKKDQVSLRSTIEDSYEYCRFIITTNDLKRIDRAIQSRMFGISFDVPLIRSGEIIARLTVRFGEKLKHLGICYDEKELRQIVMMHFPDFRQTLNQIEFRFG